MKLTNNQWIIVGVVALIAIWYFFIRKKPSESESSYKVTKSKSKASFDCPYCCGWGCEACPWYC